MKERLQVARQLFELVVYLDESFGILGGNFCEFCFGAFAVGPPGNDVAVGEGNLDGGIARHHAQSMIAPGRKSEITSGRSMLAI